MASHFHGAPGADFRQSTPPARALTDAARVVATAARVSAAILVAIALLAVASAPALGEVTSLGDVTPEDIPVLGGNVPNIVVGGTGMMINDTDTGQLIIDVPTETDALVSQTGIIGGEADSSGLVQIFTIGSVWRINNQLTIGEFGQGTLELINGGQLSENPDNPGSSTFQVIIGEQLGSQGFANLRGTGSLLRSGQLIIGEAGFGQMQLTTRARATTVGTAVIGDFNTGNQIGTGFVTVDGQLTRWTVGPTTTVGLPGTLVVGRGGRGVLNVTNQGEVRVTDDSGTGGNLTIGQLAGSYGEVNVSDLFSQLWSFGTINIGATNNARGILRSNSGGLVRANQDIIIGVDGVLEVSGGTVLTPVGITNNGTIQTSVGGIGQIDSDVQNNASGEIRVAGTVDRVRERLIFTRGVTNEGLITSIGGEMEFLTLVTNDAAGTIAGRDAVYRFRDGLTNDGILGFSVGDSDVFGTIINNGDIAIGFDTNVTFYDEVFNSGSIQLASTGTAMFLQDLSFTSTAAMSVQLNEVASVTDFSQMHIAGLTTLDGTLAVEALSGLDPQPGDSYTILTGTNITGTFDAVSFPSAPGLNWQIEYNPTSVVLNFLDVPPFNSDWNMDDIVNGDDLAIWRANFGMMVPPGTMGDADGDGDVDGADFTIWQRQLGTDPVAAPAAGAVPEPASAALLLLVALAFAARRRVE